MSEFIYQEPFPVGEDKTEYRLLTKDYVKVVECDGRKILKVDPAGLELLSKAAYSDVSFYLRAAHLQKLRNILDDPEATDNDKFVAYTMLLNQCVAAEGELPTCQDTGTAICIAHKGEDVWTGADDAECIAKGVYETYKERNLRYSQDTQDGVHGDPQYYLLHEQPFETTGGSNATIDYTLPKMCSVTPEAFTWEDIVALHYDATVQVDGEDSPLKGADKVYLMARATYDGGAQESVVDVVGSKTLMLSESKDKWVLYIYPHEFFGIPAEKRIENVSFYMVNEDKSIEVKMPDGEEFSFPENNK